MPVTIDCRLPHPQRVLGSHYWCPCTLAFPWSILGTMDSCSLCRWTYRSSTANSACRLVASNDCPCLIGSHHPDRLPLTRFRNTVVPSPAPVAPAALCSELSHCSRSIRRRSISSAAVALAVGLLLVLPLSTLFLCHHTRSSELSCCSLRSSDRSGGLPSASHSIGSVVLVDATHCGLTVRTFFVPSYTRSRSNSQ